MKKLYTILAALALAATAEAQIGAPYIHDPSTIA
jgi:arabinan endo-1,5-alpha-L-arabinosidase